VGCRAPLKSSEFGISEKEMWVLRVSDSAGRYSVLADDPNGGSGGAPGYGDGKVANREISLGSAQRDRKGSLNDGRIQNPSNPFGIVPLSNFVPWGFGFVHLSIAIRVHESAKP
jgi:hypothetical protein